MRTLRILTFLLLCLEGTHASAQLDSKTFIRVKVPFPFIAADQRFAQGQYLITTAQAERSIRLTWPSGTSVLLDSPSYAERPSHNSLLLFHRYGDMYFPKVVRTEGDNVARTLPDGKSEQELVRSGALHQVATIFQASSGR